jgi:hypothetical protein
LPRLHCGRGRRGDRHLADYPNWRLPSRGD